MLIAAIMALVTIASISFAYFTTTIEEDGDVNSLKGKAMLDGYRISFSEVNEGISITNSYPMPDSMGLKMSPYTFTVTSEEATRATGISVIVEVLKTSTLADNLVSIGIDDKVKPLSSAVSVNPSEEDYTTAYKIDEFTLQPGESKTVNIRAWINSTGTLANAQNKTWSSRILLQPDTVSSTQNTLSTLKVTSKGAKTNFADPATTDEGIYEMADDYGTSYYYRGAVTNNYVRFAGFYWRIIRINGDGSLRIIYDGTSAHENGVNDSDRFTHTEQSFNYSDDAKYVGWMYGPANETEGTTTPSTTKAEAQTNTVSSDIKKVVDTWYKTNIEDAGYGSAVADVLFCNDRSTPGKDITGLSSDTGLGYGKNVTAYGAYARLGGVLSGPNYNNPQPTFKCPEKNDAFTVSDDKKGNGALTYPVGLITADEIVAAGSGKFATENQSYYLYRPSSRYWTLSPYNFDNSFSDIFNVYTNGALTMISVNYGANAVAPVINLSAEYASTMIGDGTIGNEYRVE